MIHLSRCPDCGGPLEGWSGEHHSIQCSRVTDERPEWREPSEPVNLWDLPIFGWAWREDGKDLRA